MSPIHPDNTACIIVDIQSRLCSALHQAHTMIANSLTLLQGLQALNIPLIITEQYPQGLGSTVDAIRQLTANTPIIEKTRFSALTPEIEPFIHNKTHIILIGVETHVCILQTALDLQQKQHSVWIPAECTTSRRLTHRDNALQHMQQTGTTISNIESILFLLLQDARHPAFKTISRLIK